MTYHKTKLRWINEIWQNFHRILSAPWWGFYDGLKRQDKMVSRENAEKELKEWRWEDGREGRWWWDCEKRLQDEKKSEIVRRGFKMRRNWQEISPLLLLTLASTLASSGGFGCLVGKEVYLIERKRSRNSWNIIALWFSSQSWCLNVVASIWGFLAKIPI